MQHDAIMEQHAIEGMGRTIAASLTGRYLSILLIGSTARGEITTDSCGHILSDLDFLVVVPQTSLVRALLEMRCCRYRLNSLDSDFRRSPFAHVSVGLAPAVPRYWDMATPLMWELRTTGRVVSGSPDVLEWPAAQTARHIPRWEGIRLIANRLCELIALLGSRGSLTPTAPDRVIAYGCMKLALACSEAILIGSGLYRPTYRQRRHQHARVARYFTQAQNAAIESAYQVKMGECAIGPQSIAISIRETLDLSLATLARVGITSPVHFARCLADQSHTAPGAISDALFWTMQSFHLRGVPFRHPITDAYGDAYRVAEEGAATGALPAMLSRRVAARYQTYPQIVSMIREPRRSRLRLVTGG